LNALYYGDNLIVLREHIKDESVDLIYLDPPFNSNASYNILFQTPKGQDSQAQIEAFKDIPLLNSASNERLGYPTQKPLALLERIVEASSNIGPVHWSMHGPLRTRKRARMAVLTG